MVKVKEDMTGWVMSEHGVQDSRLTVIEQADDYIDSSGRHRSQWLCECNCKNHNKIIALGQSVKSGTTKSCGCLNKERLPYLFEQNKKTNIYSDKKIDEHGEYYIIYSNPNQEEYGYIDADDLLRVKQHSWCISNGYFASCINGKNIRMHQFLYGNFVDHKDCNPLNNRKYNMRKCNNEENNRNRRNAKISNSGYRGVVALKSGKYKAQIQTRNDGTRKNVYGVIRDTAEEAYIDYLKLAAEYHGEFSCVLDDFEKYNIPVSENRGSYNGQSM